MTLKELFEKSKNDEEIKQQVTLMIRHAYKMREAILDSQISEYNTDRTDRASASETNFEKAIRYAIKTAKRAWYFRTHNDLVIDGLCNPYEKDSKVKVSAAFECAYAIIKAFGPFEDEASRELTERIGVILAHNI